MDCEATKRNLLESMLLDASAEPTDLPLSLLKSITNGFSDDNRVGSGGFAVVYKAKLQNGVVAVKKLFQALDLHEKNFNQEVNCLMRVRHKNIVRFLGYCADTQGKICNYEGKMVMADERERLLCFEFVPNGNLERYITDASQGLEWSIRYQLIKGICEGLYYLHRNKIVHLDLKPANVLIDHNMVPKIADFGLSRCFDENQSHAITSTLVGTLGYLAPEFFFGREIRSELDIYSLGVIIIEMLTGRKGYFEIKNVLESWSNRFGTSQGDTRLEQVRVCAEIGLDCIESDPRKRRTTQCILRKLDEMESRCGFILNGISTSPVTHGQSQDLDIWEAESSTIQKKYMDYNFLDYHEKVIDGFYDIFVSSMESSRQGKMPSLADLRTGIGDLGFEVILVNRAIDSTLQEMEHVAQCIMLDFPVANIALLVQRIAELVTDNMGGPVKDADDMLTRWLEKSTELRTSRQTSLLPIGCIKIGLLRHRALLFKILADSVGIPCKLVKGRNYTGGCDDDAINIIKMDNEREFLVDLMAAPGALIPADILSWKGNLLNSNRKLTLNQTAGSSSTVDANMDPTVLPLEPKGPDHRNNELQKRRENIVPDAGRPQQRLVMKNWSPYNDVSNNKQYNYVEDSFARRNVGNNAASSPSQMPRRAVRSNLNSGLRNDASYHNYDSIMAGTSAMKITSTAETGKVPERVLRGDLDKGQTNYRLEDQHVVVQPPQERLPWGNLAEGRVPMNIVQSQAKQHIENMDVKQDHKKLLPDPKKSPLVDFDDVSECEIPWEDLAIGERIGLGLYGEVYRADWNGTEVAVKKLWDQDFYGDALDEFRSEVRIMRRPRHPNIVLFMGVVTRPPNISIVSEYLPRGSLHKILHSSNCLIDEKRRIKMALHVAKGMNCLHTSVPTIVHRDLKSPNLLVDNNWNVKVCNFGLSRLKHSTFLSSKSTAGTPEWMAPEVLRNEQSNEKCDVYSFGVILWELATLRMPWRGMNPMQVVGAVGFQDRRLDIPKEVDPLVARIIFECWQKDPNLRPSFAQLTSALKTVQRLVIPSHQETQSPDVDQEISVNLTP